MRAQQAPQDDTQSWNEIQFTVPIKKWVEMTATGQVRLGRDITDFVDERGSMGFNFLLGNCSGRGVGFKSKVIECLTLSPSLTHIATQPVNTRKLFENRANFAATLRFPAFKRITVTDRNLFERRFRDPSNSTRYRNRLQFEYTRPDEGSKTKRKHLFVSDEIFYDWSVDEWVRNRFTLGAGRTFSPMFRGDLYYLRQNDGRSRPGDLHVIGTTLRVTFK